MRPAASVRSEPGSNSQVKLFRDPISRTNPALITYFKIKNDLNYFIRIDVCLYLSSFAVKAKEDQISYLVVKEQNFEGSQFVCFVFIVKRRHTSKPFLLEILNFFQIFTMLRTRVLILL